MIDTIGLIVSIVGAVTLALVSVGRLGGRLPFVGHWRRAPDPPHFRRYMIAAAVPGLPGLAMVMLSERLLGGSLARAGLPLLGIGFILAVHACQPGRSWWRTAAALVAVAAGGGIWLLAAERSARTGGFAPIVAMSGIMAGALAMAAGMWAFDFEPRQEDRAGPEPNPGPSARPPAQQPAPDAQIPPARGPDGGPSF